MRTVDANTFVDYVLMLLVVLAGFALGRILKVICEYAAMQARPDRDGFRRALLETAARTVTFPAAVIGICIASRLAALPANMSKLRGDLTAVLLTVAVTYTLYQAVALADYWLQRLTAKAKTIPDDMMAPVVRKTLRSVVVLFGLVHMAQQLSDKPVTSILAGLGVGGLAVALAAQDTIKNFFGSLVIFADHPFHLGDLIAVDGTDGTVEQVGMRSTRIRTLDGHLVTIPNGELANKTIRNVSKRPYIKRTASITITYDTPPEKVQQAVAIVREALERRKQKLHPDFPARVFFNDFGASALNIQVIYWFAPPTDYWEFMAFDEAVHLEILRRFNEAGIDFAFPTQTLYLAGDARRPLNSLA